MLSEARRRMSAATLFAFQLMYSVAKAISAAAARFDTYGLGCRPGRGLLRLAGLAPDGAIVVGGAEGAPTVDAPCPEFGTEIPQPAADRQRRHSATLPEPRSAVTT